jgi:small subunit ribosomal protein S29
LHVLPVLLQAFYAPQPVGLPSDPLLHLLLLLLLQAFYSPRPSKLQRKGGCRSLQAEFDSTGSSSLMWRRSTQELAAALSSSSNATQAIHLRGPSGAGKSIAVVQLVEWARNNDW